jgi:Dolichyl-phosphate-mannose-protein mannosyltransferase
VTSVAARRDGATAARAWGDRLLAAVPLASIFLWLCFAYLWQAWLTPTAWFFYDELFYAELARSIADTGHEALRGHPESFTTLYSFLTAPAWLLHDTERAYGAAKAVGVVAMTSVAFPAYALARSLVSRRAALFAAAASAVIPSLAYSSLLLTETVAYPWAAFCFLATLKALVTRRPRWIVLAVATCAAAPAVRAQLAIVPVAAAVTALVFALTGERARARIAAAPRVAWPALVLGAVALALAIDGVLVRTSTVWESVTRHQADQIPKFALWSLGALAIGVGVLPLVIGLATVGSLQGRTATDRAFATLLGTNVVAFAFYTGLKAAYLAPVWKTLVEERNVIYLSPLLFTATAIWLERRAVRSLALGVSGAIVALLVWRTPLHFSYPDIEALGLSLPAWTHRHDGWSPHLWHVLLVGAAAASVAVALAARTRVRRLAAVIVAACGAFVLAWNAGGELAASAFSREFSGRLRDAVPRPLDWVDRANGRTPTIYLAHAVENTNSLHEIEFWNRSIHTLANLDGVYYPGPGPVFAVRPNAVNGKLEPDPGDGYALAESGIEPVGTRVVARGSWTLYRLRRPLRVGALETGVSDDGWMAGRSSYARYTGPAGRLRVTVARTGWCGPDPGGAAVLRVTEIRGSREIRVASRRRLLGSCTGPHATVVFAGLPVLRPPFRADLTVTRTFVPSQLDSRETDARTLGAQPTFSFTPD